jgi:hypothetical protein
MPYIPIQPLWNAIISSRHIKHIPGLARPLKPIVAILIEHTSYTSQSLPSNNKLSLLNQHDAIYIQDLLLSSNCDDSCCPSCLPSIHHYHTYNIYLQHRNLIGAGIVCSSFISTILISIDLIRSDLVGTGDYTSDHTSDLERSPGDHVRNAVELHQRLYYRYRALSLRLFDFCSSCALWYWILDCTSCTSRTARHRRIRCATAAEYVQQARGAFYHTYFGAISFV